MKKLLPSPSISSSSSSIITSSSSSSFDPNMCTSRSATASCLTGILRRLLCSRTLPTYPSDQIAVDEIKQQNDHFIKSNHSATSPGIVAKLMGLQSFPDNNSLSSLEFGDEIKDQKNRRHSSTFSFSEMPAFFELENEEFYVIRFEKRDSKTENRSKKKKYEMGFEEFRDQKCKTLEISADSGFQGMKKSRRRRRWKKKKANEDEECSSEDLSPVSVLDFDQLDKQIPTSEEDTIPRRKLSSRLNDYVQLSVEIENEAIIKDDSNSKKREEMCCELNVWGEICRMAKDEVVDESNWKSKDVGDISADFELQILDLLLDELVDQLSSKQKFQPAVRWY